MAKAAKKKAVKSAEDEIKKRADKITFDKRVRTVMDYILRGFNTKDIISHCKTKYEVEECMAYRYIKAAYKEIKTISNAKLEEKMAVAVAMRLQLFNELEGKKTPAGASVADGILSGIEKIQGLHVHKVEHDVKITKIKVTRK